MSPRLIVISLVALLLLPYHRVDALLLYGCNLSDNLCEAGEQCYPDGLFGQCYSDDSGTPPPTVLTDLDDTQLELLQLELKRLSSQGQEWPDQRAQCVLAYFKLSISYDLKYDSDFCQVRNPTNIWALVQLIDLGLKEAAIEEAVAEEVAEAAAEQEAVDEALEEVEPGDIVDRDQLEDALAEAEPAAEIEDLTDRQVEAILREIAEPAPEFDDDALSTLNLPELPPTDSEVVTEYLSEILADRQPDLAPLSDDQLNALIGSILALKAEYQEKDEAADESVEEPEAAEQAKEQQMEQQGEVADAIAVDERQAPNMLKKDVEQLGDVRLGLDPSVHNIVKGRRSDVSRVVGNRIYLKVNIKSEDQLLPLIEFLQNTIATPNNLLFDDFTFEDGQLSLRISRLNGARRAPKEKRIDTVEGVAQAVYKRRKDIARLSGAEVDETGIGIGDESVPVANAEQDWLFFPLLFVSVFTMTSLVGVLAVHMYKRRRGSNYSANIRQLADAVDGKSSYAYQELCRQRMSQGETGGPAPHSKTSSTSSWCEEAVASSIDISTGHVLLSFLQDSLSDPTRIDQQWTAIADYASQGKSTAIAQRHPAANRTVLPYDENLVPIDSDGEGTSTGEYLNASFIYDDDPRQPLYIAAQTPLASEVAAFWKAVWQQGVCLIVNLSSMDERRAAEEAPYWPEKGSQIHAHFEIHLVSEHIWSDDYLVRSFYLKNLRDGETRTITQFHYVGWQPNSAPATPKSLLEFRRKVNKSYRGRATPLLVHSTEGAGRTGVYCAVDIICGRIQRGVKELDIAASVEHLRDQRPQLVKTADQYKFLYACVAQEVSALVKALPQ